MPTTSADSGELQFNVGFEPVREVVTFRHGVAFSLQPTRELPAADVVERMVPKIARFNEYLRIYPEDFEGFSMWYWLQDDDRSDNYPVAAIPSWQAEPGYFIFVGRLQPANSIDVDLILDDFDRLLPLYEYVESAEAFRARALNRGGFAWSPGNKARVPQAIVSRKAQTVEQSLRHNVLQAALYDLLEDSHGFENTSGEQNCGNGTLVDVAVRDKKGYVYYEIKTGLSAQACIREALGQLLEYAFWPGAQSAYRLVIVGEEHFDKNARAYIELLRRKFRLPIEYQQLDTKSGRLVENEA